MWKSFPILLFPFFLILGCHCLPLGELQPIVEQKSHILTKRLAVGIPITIKEAPFMAMILLNYSMNQTEKYRLICGGALISNQHVLTAAHCVLTKDIHDLKVMVGETNFFPDERSNLSAISVKEISVHSEFNRTQKIHDIAILHLAEAVQIGEKIGQICLSTKNDFTNHTVYVYGWGEQYISPYNSTLNELELSVRSNEDCETEINNHLQAINNLSESVRLNSDHICAGEQGKNGCMADSGDPLIIKNASPTDRSSVIGVLSMGGKCGQNFPNVYARITSYLDWIINITSPSSICKQ